MPPRFGGMPSGSRRRRPRPVVLRIGRTLPLGHASRLLLLTLELMLSSDCRASGRIGCRTDGAQRPFPRRHFDDHVQTYWGRIRNRGATSAPVPDGAGATRIKRLLLV